jgi:hypothetical protein
MSKSANVKKAVKKAAKQGNQKKQSKKQKRQFKKIKDEGKKFLHGAA